MRTPRAARASVIAVLAVALLAASGCAPETDGAATATPSSASTPRPTPTSTPTPTPTATASPTPTPSPTTQPPAETGMSAAQAAEVCRDLYAGSGTTTITGAARVERRSLEPRWFVYFPGRNPNGAAAVMCILGGDPANPDVLAVNERVPMSEAEIQRDLGSNDQYLP